ncbi:MAG TPA: hydrogenase maturation protease [Candidatus Binatia bacterium]|nr:hydrogenase maturation protease [Candidatus Binatia bacterium]
MDSNNRALIASVGNILLSDDAFGAAVIRRLAARLLDDNVRVADFGIRSVHLAYEILREKYQTVIIVDAMSRGGAPGDLYILDPSQADGRDCDTVAAASLTSETVIRLLRKLSARPKRLLFVGCEPQTLNQDIGLSEPVDHAVGKAVEIILRTLNEHESASAEA